eukprot:TRINITY_DN1912_c0_g1_i10.p1 TRINITY_DN1912_c0_g1~~TRINITY_DN1912_c0_g1_i10.p1  ORF type:complete len:135 (+),score=21.10 TRINITY_DN1912_c0_g1_i10:106-510(+)
MRRVRGLSVNEAMAQMMLHRKQRSKVIYRILRNAKDHAINNFGLDPAKLYVAEAIVNKGTHLKRMIPHAKGRAGIMIKRYCRLTVLVQEWPSDEKGLPQDGRVGRVGRRYDTILRHEEQRKNYLAEKQKRNASN